MYHILCAPHIYPNALLFGAEHANNNNMSSSSFQKSSSRRRAQRNYVDWKVDIGTKGIRFTRLDEFIVRALRLKSERLFVFKKNNKTRKDGGLKKVLSASDLVVIGVGGIVGAGVFVLTGTAAKENAGPALIVSYLIAMCASVFTALCYSEFATCAPTSGSAYTFISITFGEVFAYITGWNLAIELTVGGAAVARGFTSYLATLFGLKPDAMRVKIIEHAIELDFCAFLLVSAMTLTIFRGMEQTKNFQFVVVTLAMATIAFVIIVGSAEVDVDNYTPFIPPEFGWQGVMSAASVVFFAFIGFDTVATLAEETKNPGKDLPIGILGSLAISGILYCAMAGVITGMVSYEQIDVDAPFSVAFTKNGIPWASVVVSCGAIFCIVTSLLGCLVGQPRVYMAMARDGLMPKCIANVSETYGTPVNASILTWALTGVLTLVFDIGILAQMVSIGTLTIFCGVNLALLVRRYTPKDVRFDDMNARWPALSRALYLLIACLSLCFSVTYELELVLQILSAIAVCYTILSFHLYGLKTFPQTNGFCNAPNTQTQFTAPFVPLFPSLGVLATSQLIVSLGSLAHVRFALVCLIALASYVAMDYVRCCEYYEIPSEEEEEKA